MVAAEVLRKRGWGGGRRWSWKRYSEGAASKQQIPRGNDRKKGKSKGKGKGKGKNNTEVLHCVQDDGEDG